MVCKSIPDMVIFHEPNRLEFLVDGKSIATAQHSGAKAMFEVIKLAPADLREEVIQHVYNLPILNLVEAKSISLSKPAPYSAGFIRT
ncbi:MAG: hypothetical protein JKY82_00010 [Rhizobiaceae bacterium]|nr:hypothetical protein [Rhizobiaceae bacterium]